MGIGIHWRDRWWVPIDKRDITQERALAVLEHRDPDKAAREWYRKERLWYRYHLSFPPDPDGEFVDDWIMAFHALVPQSLAVNRSAESMEKRKEAVREWWRRNGRTYRLGRRKGQGGPRRAVRPGS